MEEPPHLNDSTNDWLTGGSVAAQTVGGAVGMAGMATGNPALMAVGAAISALPALLELIRGNYNRDKNSRYITKELREAYWLLKNEGADLPELPQGDYADSAEQVKALVKAVEEQGRRFQGPKIQQADLSKLRRINAELRRRGEAEIPEGQFGQSRDPNVARMEAEMIERRHEEMFGEKDSGITTVDRNLGRLAEKFAPELHEKAGHGHRFQSDEDYELWRREVMDQVRKKTRGAIGMVSKLNPGGTNPQPQQQQPSNNAWTPI